MPKPTEITIKIVTEQDSDELESKIRNALFGIADISDISTEELECNGIENETKTVYDFIKKNLDKFKAIRTQEELELRVRAYNDIIGLDDYEDADEGIEWVCFGELFEEVKKLYDEKNIQPSTLTKKEFEEWQKRMTGFGCEIVKFEDKSNKTIFRPIRDKEAKEKGMYIVDRVVRKYGGIRWTPEMYIAMKKTDLFDMDKE